MALTIVIVVATVGGYVLGFFAGQAYWSRLGKRASCEPARGEPQAARPASTPSDIVDLQVKLLRAQSDLVRLEFKCAELAAQLKALEHAQPHIIDKIS